ncbi:MAG TPA: hypothetical protein VHB70_07605 [Parafilimonas sp.]|nr:hypothetical protein [Parafilimonas sp.]
MSPKLAIAFCIFIMAFYGCQKDVQKQTASIAAVNNAVAVNNGTVDSTGRWYGTYKTVYSDPDVLPDTVSEASLIHGGEASVNNLTPDQTQLSSVGYFMPGDKKIPGDSTTFTAVVTDNVNIVQIDIMGRQNIAHATCVKKGDSSIITLSVGKSITTSVVKPAINFSAFREVSLIVKEKKAVLQIGNVSKTMLLFKQADKLGSIKLLSVGYNYQPSISDPRNSVIACTGVHLSNSYNHQPVMKETFSTSGKSNTVFY